MFVFEIDDKSVDQFGLKPMNCPGHCIQSQSSFLQRITSRLADFEALHRNEAIVNTSQTISPGRCSHLLQRITDQGRSKRRSWISSLMCIPYLVSLMLTSQIWKKAEDALAEALNEFGKPWEISKGDSFLWSENRYQCEKKLTMCNIEAWFPASWKIQPFIRIKFEKHQLWYLGSVERMFLYCSSITKVNGLSGLVPVKLLSSLFQTNLKRTRLRSGNDYMMLASPNRCWCQW